MCDQLQDGGRTLDRRRLMVGAAGALASAGFAKSLAWPELADAHGRLGTIPPPEPIPGGLQIPDGPLLHIFLPGPEDVTLPFSGLTLQGVNVEPSTITDFKGFTAVAMVTGTATGSDDKEYNFEADIRAFKGQYIAADQRRRRGSFALI